MKWIKKINWKVKLLFSILSGSLLVIMFLFGITYEYFVGKMTANNEKIVHLTFQEAEKDLKSMMANAEDQLNRFYNNPLAWKFSDNAYSGKLDKAQTVQKIVTKFDEMLSSSVDDYGFALVSGDGRVVLSTVEKKSRTGKTILTDSMKRFMKESKENYPYVTWEAESEVEISENDPLYAMVNRPVLLGMKSLEAGESIGDDSYLLVALDEEHVQKSYGQAGYNGSESVLLNGDKRIISATEKELLGKTYVPRKENQNIQYDITYKNWKFVNMIPKDIYLQEAQDLRYVGMMFMILAILGVTGVAVWWVRSYTRPIQLLMEQMDNVGKEQLDIKKPDKMGLPELDSLNEEFYFTVQKLKGYIRRLQEVEQEKGKEELLALQYQINPHFLYNSLNSIRWMALMTNNTKVADSLVTLSKVIMPILRNPDFKWKLKNEMEFLRNYMDMMEIRYGNTMDYHWECEKNLEDEIIPRFILQPVIENCFVHGGSNIEIRRIVLRIRKKEKFYIEVQNTGVRVDAEKIQQINQSMRRQENTGNHIGLANVYKRIKLLYGDQGDVSIESNEEGFFVHIVF